MKKISQILKKTSKINEDLETNLYPEGWKDLDGIMFKIAKNNHQIEIPSQIENPEAVKLFSKIFESREMSHMYHLQVKGDHGSYAAHMALGSYYEDIQGLADSLIEVYQGQYQIVDGYDIIDSSITRTKDRIAYFQETVAFIRQTRGCIPQEDSHLHNIIDEIVALLYRTLYKLKYNK